MSNKIKAWWWTIAGASTVGLISSLVQTIERINYAKNPSVALTCDLNSVFSCSNVFDAWQSSVFGFSNSLICMIFFATTAGITLAAASGGRLNNKLRHIFHFFSVFFLGFGAWYLWQSTYRIGAICIFCIFCYSAVILMNLAWFRIQYSYYRATLDSKSWLHKFVKNGADVFLAILWAIAVAAMIAKRFWFS